jgi:hypothetical protein
MNGIKIAYTDKEITAFGGISLMKQMLEKIKIKEELEKMGLPKQGSNRGYDPIQLISNFLIGIWCGGNRYEHFEVTRRDEVIREIFGWKKMSGHKAIGRYLSKFDQGTNQRIFREMNQWFFGGMKFDNYTLDCDSTIMTRYGEQEGAKKGYNPKKRGRKSQHPLIAFVDESRMVSNFWLRSGDSHSANNFLSFLEDTLENLRGKKIGLLRCDSGFYSKEILEYLEGDRKINYIISARFSRAIKNKIVKEKSWMRLGEGIEIGETRYKAENWKEERRIVMVRQDVRLRPEAAGKQLRLFADEILYRNYRYSCFITNMDLPARAIYDLYRNRAQAENRIKELKEDFGAGSFVSKKFWATEAALKLVMMAYNLMSLFRQGVLGSKTEMQLKTLRYKVFAIGGYIIKRGNNRILKLSLAMKRREWFNGLWKETNFMSWPFTAEI